MTENINPNTIQTNNDNSILHKPSVKTPTQHNNNNIDTYLLSPYNINKLPYYTSNEVSKHNTVNDIWITLYDKVLNLTQFIQSEQSKLDNPYVHGIYPIIKNAGNDISHWFTNNINNNNKLTIKTYIDPVTDLVSPYMPHGYISHINPVQPATDFDITYDNKHIEWFNNSEYVIGYLTIQSRYILITNTLTSTTDKIEVCSEDTLYDIIERYTYINPNAGLYTWKYNGIVLDYNKTLHDNNIIDDSNELIELGINDELYLPELHIYWNDDIDVL